MRFQSFKNCSTCQQNKNSKNPNPTCLDNVVKFIMLKKPYEEIVSTQNLIAIDNTTSSEFVKRYIDLVENGFDLLSKNKIDGGITFFNPGDLYDGLTVVQLMSNSHESRTRNKPIALLFKACGRVEKYDSGTDWIKHLYKANALIKSGFEVVKKSFRVTLYKETSQKKSGKGINSLYENTKHNLSKIQVQLNNTPAKTIERLVKPLRYVGKTVYCGSKKARGYHVK